MNTPASYLKFGLCACISLVNSSYCQEVQWEKREVQLTAPFGAQEIDFIYKFKNLGKLPVSFSAPATSCGCAVAEWKKKYYLPGETGVLYGTYHTGGRRGRNVAAISIAGNVIDGNVQRPFTENLKLIVMVPEAVKVFPGITLWKKDSELLEKVIRFEIIDSQLSSLALKEVSNKTYSVNWREIDAGKTYELVVVPLSTKSADTTIVTVEGIRDGGHIHRFHAHLLVR